METCQICQCEDATFFDNDGSGYCLDCWMKREIEDTDVNDDDE